MTRHHAIELLRAHITGIAFMKHALAAEAAMRAYARRFGEDEELWGIVGLLHDFHWERCPDLADRPFSGVKILREWGWSDEVIEAVLAHADHAGELRDTLMKKALFATDKLVGLITATALVRPDKMLAGVKVECVINKMKDKSYAAAMKRDKIIHSAEQLGHECSDHAALEFADHINLILDAMQAVAGNLPI